MAFSLRCGFLPQTGFSPLRLERKGASMSSLSFWRLASIERCCSFQGNRVGTTVLRYAKRVALPSFGPRSSVFFTCGGYWLMLALVGSHPCFALAICPKARYHEPLSSLTTSRSFIMAVPVSDIHGCGRRNTCCNKQVQDPRSPSKFLRGG